MKMPKPHKDCKYPFYLNDTHTAMFLLSKREYDRDV